MDFASTAMSLLNWYFSSAFYVFTDYQIKVTNQSANTNCMSDVRLRLGFSILFGYLI